MPTSSVALDTTQYVRINVGYKSMILQAHNDTVRIVVSELKPAKSNTAFHTLGGGDAPLRLDIVNDNVWVLAMTEKSSLIVTESTTSYATEETASQLVMSVTNAIDEVAYDLNAAPFSVTTNILKDYDLISVEFNFTTTSARDITITSHDGTVLMEDLNCVDKSLVWDDIHQSYKSGENITVTMTQTGGACLADVILRVQSGTNTLIGDPHVGWFDTNGTKYGYQLAGSGRPRISTVPYGHEISSGNLPGHVSLPGFGERENVQTPVGNVGEDIWRGVATTIPHPSSAGEQMTVVSSSAQDSAAGTGISQIRIQYIRASDGQEAVEDITLNGTTPVNTVATDIVFVNHMFSVARGAASTTGVADGNINIYKLGDATTVYNRIMAGGNKDLTIAIRVPSNKTYFINEWHCSVAGNKPTAVRLRSTDWNGVLYNGDDPVFIFKDTAFIAEGNFDRTLDPPVAIPGGSTIKISAWATQAGAYISGSFGGFYE